MSKTKFGRIGYYLMLGKPFRQNDQASTVLEPAKEGLKIMGPIITET